VPPKLLPEPERWSRPVTGCRISNLEWIALNPADDSPFVGEAVCLPAMDDWNLASRFQPLDYRNWLARSGEDSNHGLG
jgi:hypothetical protein